MTEYTADEVLDKLLVHFTVDDITDMLRAIVVDYQNTLDGKESTLTVNK